MLEGRRIMKLESCGRAADISCYGDGYHRWNHGVIARSGEIVRIDIMAPDPHHFIVLWDGHREVNVDGPGMKFIPSATRRVELSPRKRKDPDSMLISVGDWKLIPDRPALEVLAEVAVNDRLPHCEGTRGPLEKPFSSVHGQNSADPRQMSNSKSQLPHSLADEA